MFALAIALGVGLALFYGWVLNPVELVNTTPATLRIDYQTDYVLMVAEAYHHEEDINLAVCRLALLGGEAREKVAESLVFAVEAGYTADDLALMDTLADALAAWEPGQEVCE